MYNPYTYSYKSTSFCSPIFNDILTYFERCKFETNPNNFCLIPLAAHILGLSKDPLLFFKISINLAVFSSLVPPYSCIFAIIGKFGVKYLKHVSFDKCGSNLKLYFAYKHNPPTLKYAFANSKSPIFSKISSLCIIIYIYNAINMLPTELLVQIKFTQ